MNKNPENCPCFLGKGRGGSRPIFYLVQVFLFLFCPFQLKKENKTLHTVSSQDQRAFMDHVHQEMDAIRTCLREQLKVTKSQEKAASEIKKKGGLGSSRGFKQMFNSKQP